MSTLGLAQLSSLLVAVCTPWFVAWIVLRVAAAHAGAATVHVHSMKRLRAIWAHQVITGPIVDGDAGNLRRVVRRIFAMELLLVVVCLATAHALVDLNWAANGTLGAAIALAGGVVGIAGCALAVTSGLVGRRYETVGT